MRTDPLKRPYDWHVLVKPRGETGAAPARPQPARRRHDPDNVCSLCSREVPRGALLCVRCSGEVQRLDRRRSTA